MAGCCGAASCGIWLFDAKVAELAAAGLHIAALARIDSKRRTAKGFGDSLKFQVEQPPAKRSGLAFHAKNA